METTTQAVITAPPNKTTPPEQRGVLYEHPTTDRLRHLLRLEALLTQVRAGHDAHTLSSWMALISHLRRSDIKGDGLHELERAKAWLKRMASQDGVDGKQIARYQEALRQHHQALQAWQASSMLPQHEWLDQLKSRHLVPEHAPAFEMPSLRAFLKAPEAQRKALFEGWYGPLQGLCEAVHFVLQLLRHTSPWEAATVNQGMMQRSIEAPKTPGAGSGQAPSLIRVLLPESSGIYPEIACTLRAVQLRLYRMEARSLNHESCTEPTALQWALCGFQG